jgi:uncharacterized OsmC-like protein
LILVETHRVGTGRARTAVDGRLLDVQASYGSDEKPAGFCPVQLLVAAISSCTHLTIMAVAEAKGINISSLDVEVRLEDEDAIEEGREAVIQVEVVLPTGLTNRERKILFRSGRLCPMRRLISPSVEFQDSYRIGSI